MHGRASDRARYNLKMGEGSKPRLGPDGLPLPKALHVVDAERQGVHAAVCAFLTKPTDLDLRANIEDALKVFEMRFYMKAIAARPPTEHVTIGLTKNSTHRTDLRITAHRATPAIPLACLQVTEEVTFTNPDHRSTRSEFLSDCSTYGV